MRIIAIALVVFNHTPAFTLYQSTDGAMQLLYMVIAVLTKVNIPLLFMISGALLLGKDEPLGVVMKKRFVRFLLVVCLGGGDCRVSDSQILGNR